MEAPHLLVVDDDARIRGLQGQFLRRQGFFVTAVESAARARALLAGLSFDLVVLDVMMPGEDGLSLCRHLRRQGLPVLLLTARGDTGDRIAGLEAGADDYLPKPFDPKELVLRVNAILRRAQPPEPAPPPRGRTIRLGGAVFDPERGEILADGLPPTRLTATEAELMRVLAAEPGATVSRQRLVEEVARGPGRLGGRGLSTPAQERAVDVQITRLRRKIEPDPRQPRFLQTVRGAGYRLQPD